MARPKAYSPENGYKYQILTRNPSYGREWEHCDYAVDGQDKKHLIREYSMAYGGGFEFKTIDLPQKYWAPQFFRYRYTVRVGDVGKSFHESPDLYPQFQPLGVVQAEDVGKVCIKRCNVWYVTQTPQT